MNFSSYGLNKRKNLLAELNEWSFHSLEDAMEFAHDILLDHPCTNCAIFLEDEENYYAALKLFPEECGDKPDDNNDILYGASDCEHEIHTLVMEKDGYFLIDEDEPAPCDEFFAALDATYCFHVYGLIVKDEDGLFHIVED